MLAQEAEETGETVFLAAAHRGRLIVVWDALAARLLAAARTVGGRLEGRER